APPHAHPVETTMQGPARRTARRKEGKQPMRHLRWLVMLVSLGVAPVSFADVVTDWNRVALDAIRADRIRPPRASRLLALVHLAGFDAANAVRQRYESYAVADEALRGIDREVAYAA